MPSEARLENFSIWTMNKQHIKEIICRAKRGKKKIMEKLNRAQKCSILGPQNLGSGGGPGPPGPPPPGSAPEACVKNSVHEGKVYTPRQVTPPPGRHPLPTRLLQRTVRILLECILVWSEFLTLPLADPGLPGGANVLFVIILRKLSALLDQPLSIKLN